MIQSLRSHAAWLLPVLAMLVITPFTPALDLAISHHFYDNGRAFSSSTFNTFLYNYGPLPAQLTFIGAAITLFLASFFKKWRKWLPVSLLLVLTLAIGSGLIAHVIFKDHWGRPRPRQVIEFGGHQPFRPYYSPNIFHEPEPSRATSAISSKDSGERDQSRSKRNVLSEEGVAEAMPDEEDRSGEVAAGRIPDEIVKVALFKSFPCGHCTMGFYFFAAALAAKRYNKRGLFWACLALAIVLGIALSYARIAQGGHFLSDTLGSALIMWLTAYLCDKEIFSRIKIT